MELAVGIVCLAAGGVQGSAKLDLCDVGYDYPKKVYAYGREYRISKDARRLW